MISVVVSDLRWRLALVFVATLLFYAAEPGFHQHEGLDPEAITLGPIGISAALSHLAAFSMILLLAGFVATERREGYTRLFFAQPMSPLAYYGLRWAIAFVCSLLFATGLLVLGQLVAWGTFLGGWSGLVLPLLSALVYGSLMAFFSVLLPRGDAWVVVLLLLPTFFPQIFSLLVGGAPPWLRSGLTILLPPQAALAEVWEQLLLGSFSWAAAAYAATYGLVFLGAAGLILRLREWP